MKPQFLFSKQFWFGLPALILAMVAAWVISSAAKKTTEFHALRHEPAGATLDDSSQPPNCESPTPTAHRKLENESTQGYRRLHDEMKEKGVLLISKSASTNENGGDLWLRVRSHERFVAEDVTGAKFSPDGNKIAYATISNEVFVETLAGERLAEIPRASEPSWGVESTTLSFVAVPSSDYPELEQPAIFDLKTGSIIQDSSPKPSDN